MNLTRTVYLPIELKAREFDSKLLLALELLRRDYMVVFGQQWAIYDHLAELPPGIILFKSHNAIHHPNVVKARDRGFYTMALEEEVMSLGSQKAMGKIDSKGLYDVVDRVLVHGEFELNYHLSQGCPPRKLAVVGNPRIDLLRPPNLRSAVSESLAKRDRYGDFILVNTNFGIKNSIWSVEQLIDIAIRSGAINRKDPDSIRDFVEFAEWERACDLMLKEVLKIFTERSPDVKVIVRPHPSESIEKVMHSFEGLKNIQIVKEGGVIPWILASHCLVHSSCTTGLESAIVGKPTVGLIPYQNYYSEQILSNKVCRTFQSVESAAQELTEIVSNEARQDRVEDLSEPSFSELSFYIANVRGDKSTSRIADLIDDIDCSLKHADFVGFPPSHQHEILAEKCSFTADEMVGKIHSLASHEMGLGFAFDVHEFTASLYLLAPRSPTKFSSCSNFPESAEEIS